MVAVVLGPYSSGTSAVAAAVAALGANAHPPFAAVNDPRTPVSGESVELRRIVLPAFDHTNVQRLDLPPWFVPRLRIWAGPGLSVAKLPTLAFFVPEMTAAWDVRAIRVRRDIQAIEATRLRRDWPAEYGRQGALAIEAVLDQNLKDVPVLEVQFDELRANATDVGGWIAEFLDLSPNPDAVRAAVRAD